MCTTVSPIIRTLAEPQPDQVAIRINQEAFDEAAELCDWICDDPRLSNFKEDELRLLAAAFVTTIAAMPITSLEMVHWIAASGIFSIDAIAQYAEKELNMDPVERPIQAPRRRMIARREASDPAFTMVDFEKAMEMTTPEETSNTILATFDIPEITKVVELVIKGLLPTEGHDGHRENLARFQLQNAIYYLGPQCAAIAAHETLKADLDDYRMFTAMIDNCLNIKQIN